MTILGAANIKFSRLISIRDGYVIIVNTKEDQDKILSSEMTRKLNAKQFSTIMPPEFRAQLTLVFKKLDWSIFQESEESIREELLRAAPHTKDLVGEIFRKEDTAMMKIKFLDLATALKIKEKGLRLFHTSISTNQIEHERYRNAPQCFKCYKYDHLTTDCTATGQICSECSSTTHT